MVVSRFIFYRNNLMIKKISAFIFSFYSLTTKTYLAKYPFAAPTAAESSSPRGFITGSSAGS